MVHAAGMILPLALGAVSTFANALLPAQPQSAISAPPLRGWTAPLHEVDANILEVLEVHDDPVKALLALQPELEEELAEPRLLQIFGETHLQWKTEGDKLRLRRMGKRFIDLTGQEDLLDSESAPVQPPYLPNLTHQSWIRPCFEDIEVSRMEDVVKHMSSYYNRYYASAHGVESARWLHDHLLDIISRSPAQTYISLEYVTHGFPQPSLIARFEPSSRDASLPLTVLGAHQDSANYLFPLLPAPGADDDLSGTVTILEAFRVLAMRGYIPERGPVEFHWYAAEEAGLGGSLSIARNKRDTGAKISAMLEFDMTAFIPANTTESINFVLDDAHPGLTDWCVNLSKEYVDIETRTTSMDGTGGSDYMSFTRMGYPSAFAKESDFAIENPYVHTVRDQMDLDDETGIYSIERLADRPAKRKGGEHMAQFTRLAIAYVVEQAGWSVKNTPKDDADKRRNPAMIMSPLG